MLTHVHALSERKQFRTECEQVGDLCRSAGLMRTFNLLRRSSSRLQTWLPKLLTQFHQDCASIRCLEVARRQSFPEVLSTLGNHLAFLSPSVHPFTRKKHARCKFRIVRLITAEHIIRPNPYVSEQLSSPSRPVIAAILPRAYSNH